MGVYFHSCSDAGMADGFGEGSQIKVGIVLVLDVIVGHIGMAKSVDGNGVGQADFLADFSMALAGAATNTAAKGEVGRTEKPLQIQHFSSFRKHGAELAFMFPKP